MSNNQEDLDWDWLDKLTRPKQQPLENIAIPSCCGTSSVGVSPSCGYAATADVLQISLPFPASVPVEDEPPISLSPVSPPKSRRILRKATVIPPHTTPRVRELKS